MSRKSKDAPRGFAKAGQVLRGIFKELENPRRLREAHLFGLWEQIASAEIKKRARPERLAGTTLYVAVSEPVWAFELALKYRRMLLAAFQREVGKENLTDIVFHAGRKIEYNQATNSPEKRNPPARPASGSPRQRGDKGASGNFQMHRKQASAGRQEWQ
ncbi:MAG: DUF721 domain-containing protein [Candidatus Omnitrophica bacterium]|nr:DUF721 domain-containing protein [Candidatus Omnitrophota bacterium]